MALPVAALAAIIAVAAAVAIAATVFAIYKLWKNNKKDKDEPKNGKESKSKEKEKGKGKEDDRGKDKDKTKGQKSDDKSMSTQDTESVGKPKTKMFTAIDRKSGQKYQVQGVLREDGKYHIDGKQLITRKGLQESLTIMKNSTNNSINEANQKQDEYNRQISDISRDLNATKAELAAQKQKMGEIDKLKQAVDNVSQNVIDGMFAKVGDIEVNDQQAKPVDDAKQIEQPNENLMEDIKAKEVKKGPAELNMKVINKKKEESLSK